MTAFTGANAIGAYREESSFNDHDGTGDYEPFGRNVTIDTFEGANNGVELFEFCQRAPTGVIEQNFEGTFSTTFVASTFDFLELYDDETVDEDSDSNPEYEFETPQSFEVIVDRKQSTTGTDGVTRVATGCIPQSLEVSVTVDGLLEVTIDGVYAGEEKRDEDIESSYSQVPEDKDALTFADVTFDYNGSSLELPRGVTVSLESGTSLLSTLGSREASNFTVGSLTGSVDITHAVEVDETTTLESMYGTTDSAGGDVADDNTIVITMDNGESSDSGQVKAEWTIPGFTESYAESGIDVEEEFVEADITETLSGKPSVEVTED